MVLRTLIALLLAMISVSQAVEEKQDHVSFLLPYFVNGTLSSDFFVSQLDAVDGVVFEKDELRKTASELKAVWQKLIAKTNGQNLTESEKEACRLKFERDVKN